METVLERLERARSLPDLQGAVAMARDALGVGHVAYQWASADGARFCCSTYDPAWSRRYAERGYLRVDPAVAGCWSRFHPVDWKRLDWSSKAARAFRADALAHGVGHQGLSVPIRGPAGQFALFGASHDATDAEWAALTRARQGEMILIAHYLNRRVLDLARAHAPEPVRALSPREVDALTFLAMGYARSQVAGMLSISEHTLRAYIEGARFKLGAMNTTHAVARAMAEGLIVLGGAGRGVANDRPARQGEPPPRSAAAR